MSAKGDESERVTKAIVEFETEDEHVKYAKQRVGIDDAQMRYIETLAKEG